MNHHTVTIVETGVANTASVVAAFARCGTDCVLTDDAARIHEAELLVLPGVGAFGAAMARLERAGLVEPLTDRIARGRPLLAICLGLQVLCDSSEESPGVRGLGVIDARVTRFPAGVRTPQFGWNRVEPTGEGSMVRPGHAYFANSYRLAEGFDGWIPSFADHGGRFVAALQRGTVLACQFHPELSGAWGLSLLRSWIATSLEVAPC